MSHRRSSQIRDVLLSRSLYQRGLIVKVVILYGKRLIVKVVVSERFYCQGFCIAEILSQVHCIRDILMSYCIREVSLSKLLYQRCLTVKVVASEMSYCQGCHIEVVIPDVYR